MKKLLIMFMLIISMVIIAETPLELKTKIEISKVKQELLKNEIINTKIRPDVDVTTDIDLKIIILKKGEPAPYDGIFYTREASEKFTLGYLEGKKIMIDYNFILKERNLYKELVNEVGVENALWVFKYNNLYEESVIFETRYYKMKKRYNFQVGLASVSFSIVGAETIAIIAVGIATYFYNAYK